MDRTFNDYKHAHNLYTQYNFAFSPKVKFLYHIDFSVNNDINIANNNVPLVKARNTKEFSSVISVLGKRVDLPSYRVSVDTKQQYNRKKNVQTRIDYDEVRMVFHDDNLGITRSMLEEYYNHYFRDGLNKNVNGDVTGYGSRDKYSNFVPRYGLDNGSEVAFFNYIKIFQLSKQKWFGYTLINPLLTSWQHDTLEYGDGAGIMENTVSIAYEGVIYTHGDIEGNRLTTGDQAISGGAG